MMVWVVPANGPGVAPATGTLEGLGKGVGAASWTVDLTRSGTIPKATTGTAAANSATPTAIVMRSRGTPSLAIFSSVPSPPGSLRPQGRPPVGSRRGERTRHAAEPPPAGVSLGVVAGPRPLPIRPSGST